MQAFWGKKLYCTTEGQSVAAQGLPAPLASIERANNLTAPARPIAAVLCRAEE
jgi:hypothetical protein